MIEITYEPTISALRQGKSLGRLSIKGTHAQEIIKTFYFFYEEEMEL